MPLTQTESEHLLNEAVTRGMRPEAHGILDISMKEPLIETLPLELIQAVLDTRDGIIKAILNDKNSGQTFYTLYGGNYNDPLFAFPPDIPRPAILAAKATHNENLIALNSQPWDSWTVYHPKTGKQIYSITNSPYLSK